MRRAAVCNRQEIYRPVLADERIRVTFLFQIASFWPSWESLYERLVGDARFHCKLFLVTDTTDKSKQLVTAGDFLDAHNIAYEIFSDDAFSLFAPHVAFLQTPYDYTQREQHLYARRLKHHGIRVAYIPYGIEIVDTKAARHDHFREPVQRNAWRIYTASDEFLREYDKYCENAKAVRGLGLPRFDMLKRRDRFPLPSALAERIAGRKIVVWHVHFAKKINVGGSKMQVTPYLEEYIQFAGRLSQWSREILFIFLPHPRFGDDVVDMESNKKSRQVLDILEQQENVYIDTHDDYRPSLLNAAAIISDRSSLAVEAAVVNAPVLYMKNPDYEEPLFPPLRSLFAKYEQGTGCNDMRNFVDAFAKGELAANRTDVALANFDGRCAERIANDIASSIHGEPSDDGEDSVQRLILFGTGFIYRTMREITRFPATCEVVALSDNNKEKWGSKMDGIAVIPPTSINDFEFDKIIICAENVFADEIEKQLLYDLEIPRNKVEHCDYMSLLSL